MSAPAEPNRHFLNPHRPLLPEIADRLLPEHIQGPFDLGDTLLVTPTRQAGRRLREFLAREVRGRGGTAVLSMRVVTPNHFLFPEETVPQASPFEVLQTWADTLSGIHLDTLPALMPGRTGTLTFSAAMEFGRRLQQVRNSLVDGNLDLTAVSGLHPEADEHPRWRELARIESAYRKALATQQLTDPCDAKRARAADYTPPENLQRIVLAAVPDPSPLVLTCWQRIAPQIPIEIWIHAAPEEAELFDPWGRPLPAWGQRQIGPGTDPPGWIERLADPPALTHRIADLLAENPRHPNLALGVLDRRLTPRLQNHLLPLNRKLYDPSPVRLDSCPPARLLQQLTDARTRGDSASLRTLWRNPDLLRALTDRPAHLLRLWDHYAAEHLPGSAVSIDETLQQPELRAAWEKLKTWIAARTATQWLALLQDIYSPVTLNPAKAQDRFTLRAAEALSEILQEAARRDEEGRETDPELILQVIRETTVDPLRIEGDLTAEGWLELAYHPASSLLLIGLQEGQVPGTRVADPFLPDSLRSALHLRSDRDWLARDAYLFHTLTRCREPGSVRILCMKRDAAGGPLHPSRLLFQCSDPQLLARTRLLFSEPPPPPPTPHATPGLQFDLSRPRVPPIKTLSVTAIRGYLQCPTRFYLRTVLGMRPLTDNIREPDSAAFGSLIHAVLQTGLPSEPLPLKTIQTRLTTELDRRVRALYGSHFNMAVEVLVQNARRRLHAAAEIHHQLLQEGWRILATECACERELSGLRIRGKIDRVDYHPQKGLRILDYKTSDQPADPEKAHLGTRKSQAQALWTLNAKGREREWTDLQLPLYRWLAESRDWYTPDQPLEVAYLQLPKAINDTRLVTWPEEEQQAPSARTALSHVVQCIQNGIWGPPGEQLNFDEFEHLFVHGAEGFKIPR